MAPGAKVIRFPTTPPDPRSELGFIEVHRCHLTEAPVVRGLLESEGIPTLLKSRVAHSVHPFTVGSQGEIAVMVPTEEATRSRLVLARIPPDPSFP